MGAARPCFPDATSISQRRALLLLKMTMLGGQSRAFFEWVAQWLGYQVTYIREWSPFMVGISQVGDTRDAQGNYRWEIGPPEMRFYWSVHIAAASLIWSAAAPANAASTRTCASARRPTSNASSIGGSPRRRWSFSIIQIS
jgi:uncharacterized protein YmfQ (DUF2313 family)